MIVFLIKGQTGKADAAYFLDEALGALVLDISLRGGKEGTDSVHIHAALDESRASSLQLVQSVIIGCVHHAC